MKDWIVETRVTSKRVYLVSAADEKEAIYVSTTIPPDIDEDEFEEVIVVSEHVKDIHPDQTSPMTVERERWEE